MIVYCAGAIKGDSTYKEHYQEIVNIVKVLQHSALSEINPDFNSSIPLSEKQIFARDIKWLEKSNVMIAEIRVQVSVLDLKFPTLFM